MSAKLAYKSTSSRIVTSDRNVIMAQTAERKRDRMHLRLDTASKRKLERAAAYSNRSVTEFVLANAVEAADKVIAEHERVVLNDHDRDVFFEAIMNPPEPNKALRDAMRWYRGLAKQ